MSRQRFDAAYYERFYVDARTRAHSGPEVARLAQGLDGMASWLLQRPLASALEIGAGPGFLRDWFAKERPKVRYVSTDFSAHACEQFGHQRLDVARKKLRGTFDLVICQGVLQYLDDDACARALANLTAMTRALLYLEALTERDVREVCDPDGTDVDVHLRRGRFYREHLKPGFRQVGAGFWARLGGPVSLYELEAP
jgi:SAM-dependent methyltransferase